MAGNWRHKELTQEAGASFAAPQWTALLLAAALGVAIVLLSSFELRHAQQQVAQQLAAGISVFEVRDIGAQTLNTQACMAMESGTGVEAAGAVLSPPADTVLWAPGGVNLPVRDVTSGALRAWVPQESFSAGIFAGSGLAQTIGIHPGAALSSEKGGDVVEHIADVLHPAVLPSHLQSAAVRVTGPVRDAELCVFRVAPQSIDRAADFAAAAFPNQRIEVVPYQRLDSLSSDPIAQLNSSVLQFTPYAALGLSVFVAVVLGFSQRKEFAVYRVLGTKRGELWYMLVRQYLWQALVLVAVLSGALTAAVVLLELPRELATLWFVGSGVLVYLVGLVALGPIGHLLGARGKVIENLV